MNSSSHGGDGHAKGSMEKSPLGCLQQIITFPSHPNEFITMGRQDVVSQKDPTRPTRGLLPSEHTTHSPHLDRQSKRSENLQQESAPSFLLNPVRATYDCGQTNGFRWKNDPWPP
jgi:hypothetical protein